jgi:4,5-DOPA dioxygenase extradiol
VGLAARKTSKTLGLAGFYFVACFKVDGLHLHYSTTYQLFKVRDAMIQNVLSMPALFIGHGSPMNALETNHYTQAWRQLGATMPKPKAILVISAHWYIGATAVTAMPQPKTIHDFGGFPPELFAFQYPAPGSVALAERVHYVLAPLEVKLDQSWGLDHGTWSVLAHMFPEADIPVVQLSIDRTQPNSVHYDLGKRLAALRDEGVLILASGNVAHNLPLINWQADAAYDWATRFEQNAKKYLTEKNHQALIDYDKLGQDATLSIPTPEHFLPLLYVMGAQREGDQVQFPLEGIELGTISMLSVKYSI